jgi:hypothetical protein
MVLVHGACRGLDTIAARRATLMGWQIEPHPAEWKLHGRAAGPIRNRLMVMTDPALCIAFHDHIERSKGTKDCLERAIGAAIKSALYSQTGLVKSWHW